MALPTLTGIAPCGWLHPPFSTAGCDHPAGARDNNPAQPGRATCIYDSGPRQPSGIRCSIDDKQFRARFRFGTMGTFIVLNLVTHTRRELELPAVFQLSHQ